MRIVLVDPSRLVRKTVGGMLEAGGHQVDYFADSGEAFAFVVAEPAISCVLTSLEVHPISGLELCWQLRLLAESRRPLSILVMSSDFGSRSLGEVLDSGADDFIKKPPSPDELSARLRAAERMLKLQRALIQEAETDALTRLPNRGAFFQKAEAVIARSGPDDRLVAMLMDVDHFKAINDRYGHAAGDAVLRGMAGILRETGLMVGRLGGEEFALLVEGHGTGTAAVTAHRIRIRCSALPVAGSPQSPVRFTVSIGLAAWESGEGIDALLRRADTALYAAKAGGRDRVAMADGATAIVEYVG